MSSPAAWRQTEPRDGTAAALLSGGISHYHRERRERINAGRCVACNRPRRGRHKTAVHCSPCARAANAAAQPAFDRVNAIRADAGLPPLPDVP